MAKPLHIIVAMDNLNGIGREGGIPWHIAADLKRFSALTTKTDDTAKQNAVIMGRKTWDSLPVRFRPLPRRKNLVLSLGHTDFLGAVHCGSFSSALRTAERDPEVESLFVIGGSELYRWALPHAASLYITYVTGEFNCDVVFPAIPKEFAVVAMGEAQVTPDGVEFKYAQYQRV